MGSRLRMLIVALVFASALPTVASGAEPTAEQFRADALAIEPMIQGNYAYLERLPGGRFELPPKLRVEAGAVEDGAALLRFAARALLTLADHHAITGSSFDDSWAVVPSYSDLWIERRGVVYAVTSVRQGSPAEAGGVRVGDRLVAVGSKATETAVSEFWDDLGLGFDDARAGFAARVLAAGRRDRPRDLTIARAGGAPRRLQLPNLYQSSRDSAPITVSRSGEQHIIRINDSLGNSDTIAAFDAAMAALPADADILLDLSETPGGGNTVVARAIMGWFVDRPTAYQVHNLPAEERETGIPRQWVEQVLPRAGKRHSRLPEVRVGRWTGSMGEGLAIGFAALGAKVTGEPMAGLLGAIYDHALPNSGLILKLPTERLTAVDGTPREAFVPDEVK